MPISPFPNQPLRYKLAFILFVVLFMSICCFVLTVSSAHGEQQAHSCASDMPPARTGKPIPPPAISGIILINEVLTQPASIWNCTQPARKFSQEMDTWCELYNPQNQPFDLYLSHTAISIDRGEHWHLLAPGSVIAARGFLTLFPEEAQSDITLISSIMITIHNTLVDEQNIPALAPDHSYGRVPDGSRNWLQLDYPTINASNTTTPNQTTTVSTPVRTRITGHPPAKANSGSDNSTTTPSSTGTQPPLNSLQLPTTAITTVPVHAQSLPISSTAEQSTAGNTNAGPEGWYILLIVASALGLLCALIWCWRLFRAP